MTPTPTTDAFSWKRVIVIAGAIAAFLIGSGFATGQEIMQYFTSYGWWGIFGTGLLVLVGMTFVCVEFLKVGRAMQFKNPSQIFEYYGGKILGTFYEWFSVFFIFMSYIVMIAGAGAVFDEHYGLPVWMGGVFIAVTACVTVALGLSRLSDVIGRIGPIIIGIAMILAGVGIVNYGSDLSTNAQLVHTLDITRASSNWFMAALSYVGFCLLWLATFLTAIGKSSASRKEAVTGGILGGVLFSIACMLVGIALLAALSQTQHAQIPMLVLANSIHPTLALGISVIILAGIYTTAVPLLWTACQRVNGNLDSGSRFMVITVIAATIGCVVGLLVPFATIVNYVYVINGYVAILLLALMIGNAIYRVATKKGITEAGFMRR